MALNYNQKADAVALREKSKAIVFELSNDKVTFTDDKVIIKAPQYGTEVSISVKVPGATPEDPTTETVVFQMSGDACTVFRRTDTSRWFTYINDLTEDAQAAFDDKEAVVASSFEAIDDAAIFGGIVASNVAPGTPGADAQAVEGVVAVGDNIVPAPGRRARPVDATRAQPGIQAPSGTPAPMGTPVSAQTGTPVATPVFDVEQAAQTASGVTPEMPKPSPMDSLGPPLPGLQATLTPEQQAVTTPASAPEADTSAPPEGA